MNVNYARGPGIPLWEKHWTATANASSGDTLSEIYTMTQIYAHTAIKIQRLFKQHGLDLVT